MSGAGAGSERQPPTSGCWRLPCRLEAVGEARAQVRGFLAADGPADIDAAVLAVSELVANAVVHGGPGHGDVELTVKTGTDGLHIEVFDDDPRPPELRSARSGDDRGRGLAIVAGLASAWGWTPAAGGKRVWCHLPG